MVSKSKPGLLGFLDRSFEAIDIVGDAINRNDLSAYRQALLVGQSFPQDFRQLAFISDNHTERIHEVRNFAAFLFVLEIFGRCFLVDELIAAAVQAIERSSGSMSSEPGTEEFASIVRLNAVQ